MMNVNLKINGILQPKPLEGMAQASPAPKVVSATTEGWKVVEGGMDKLKGIHGDMEVPDEALRRDDPLGRLVDRAFDPAAAANLVRDLPIA